MSAYIFCFFFFPAAAVYFVWRFRAAVFEMQKCIFFFRASPIRGRRSLSGGRRSKTRTASLHSQLRNALVLLHRRTGTTGLDFFKMHSTKDFRMSVFIYVAIFFSISIRKNNSIDCEMCMFQENIP